MWEPTTNHDGILKRQRIKKKKKIKESHPEQNKRGIQNREQKRVPVPKNPIIDFHKQKKKEKKKEAMCANRDYSMPFFFMFSLLFNTSLLAFFRPSPNFRALPHSRLILCIRTMPLTTKIADLSFSIGLRRCLRLGGLTPISAIILRSASLLYTRELANEYQSSESHCHGLIRICRSR